MRNALSTPLAPYVDALPVPRRVRAADHHHRLSVHIRAATHRFHRDLPDSTVWGYDGSVPGPTIEAERGRPVTVEWSNELDGQFPVVVTVAPAAADDHGIPVQCLPGLSGGVPDAHAAALAGHTVVHLHGGLTPAAYDGWAENLFAPRTAGRLPLPDGPTRRAALVPRPRHGHHEVRRLRRVGRAVDRPRRARARARPAGRRSRCRC